jgi:hypothetical protein
MQQDVAFAVDDAGVHVPGVQVRAAEVRCRALARTHDSGLYGRRSVEPADPTVSRLCPTPIVADG